MPDWTAIRKSLLPEQSGSLLPPTVKLPMLPRALNEFTSKAEDPEVDTRELSRIIETDSGLSTELLRYVNSSAVGVKSQVTSIQQAITLLGIRPTQLYLMTTGLKQAMKSTSSKLIHFQSFWNINLERALLARTVATLLKVDADLAFTAGMLQDFLLPLLTNQLLQEYLEFAENRDKFTNLIAFEKQKFGWDHGQAAAQVMHAWNLPDELICCVGLHHWDLGSLADDQLDKTSVAAVAISCLLPDSLRQEADGITKLIELDETWDAFELLPIAEKIDEEFQSMATDAKNSFSLLRLCKKTLAQSGQDS